jgi:bacterioferritin-associated ferredoxin
MLVCHCRAVTDSTIRTAIECGAHNVENVGQMCGAGTNCGGCVSEIERLCATMRSLTELDRLATAQLAS